jgi:general secretion pathway protein H
MAAEIARPTSPAGFSLVEVMVVLLVVSVVLGMVGLGAGRLFSDSGRDADHQALQRLALAIERGSDLAQTKGQALRLELANGRYRFLTRDDFGHWVRVGNDALLAEREIPDGWRWLALKADGEFHAAPLQLHFYGEPVRFKLQIASDRSSYVVSGNSAGLVSWLDQPTTQ